jgi:hypothetical protein
MASTIKVGNKVYASKNDGTFNKVHNENWGVYLKPCEDPESVLTDEDLDGIRIHDDFPKIPAELWSAWISLCFYMCPKGTSITNEKFHDRQLEVGVYFLRKADDKTKWKIVVPSQKVSGVQVKATLANNIDLITGEKYTQFPPKGYKHAGTSHSHNRMKAFFSGTDNVSELGSTGLHIVVGDINHSMRRYAHISSVTVHGTRKTCKLREVVDVTPVKSPFHPKVLDYIQEVVSTYSTPYRPSTRQSWSTGQKTLWDTKDFTKDSDFLRGLDKTNSDLFDGDLRSEGFSDDLVTDIIDLVGDLVRTGTHTVDDLITLLDENRDLLEDADDEVIISMLESPGDSARRDVSSLFADNISDDEGLTW